VYCRSVFKDQDGCVCVPGGPLPSSILLWDVEELRDPPAAPCCLRSTRAGSRAAVYRTAPGGAVAAFVDFVADAEAQSGGGWAAEGVVHLLGSPLPRSVLLADDLLSSVFRHLRGRRGLPEPVAWRLMSLLDATLVCTVVGSASRASPS
jgi:hypothetical protein